MIGNVIQEVLPPVTSFRNAETINVLSHECLGLDMLYVASAFGSAVWTANLATYIPLFTMQPILVSQFFWFNGTAVNGNSDVGIYSQDGATKVSSTGSTANSGTSQIQVVNVSDVLLAANQRYWLALASDSGTQTFWRSTATARAQDYCAVKQQTSAWSSGLPASATFATPSVAVLPFFGFTGTTI